MDKQEINRLAYNISTNDWDEKEKSKSMLYVVEM